MSTAQHLRRAAVARCEIQGCVPERNVIMAKLMVGLVQYLSFYKAERPHKSLDYRAPNHAYSAGVSSGALTVDRFGGETDKSQENSSTGQRRAADEVELGMA